MMVMFVLTLSLLTGMLAVRARFLQAWIGLAQVEERAAEDVTQGHVHGIDPRHRQRVRRQRPLPQDPRQRHHPGA